MKIIILNILDFLFARKFLFPINLVMHKLFVRFIGYNNHKSLNSSGEKILEKICKTDPSLCIDIGANVGTYSNYILNNSNSKVIAFEPIPKSFKKLNLLKKNSMIDY